MLEITVCSLTVLIDYLSNTDILGQGNLILVSEKSGKSQGILLSMFCGNPVIDYMSHILRKPRVRVVRVIQFCIVPSSFPQPVWNHIRVPIAQI